MFPLTWHTIKKRRTTLLVYILISVFLTWMLVAIYPDMSRQAEELTQAFQNYPESFMKALDVELQNMFLSLEGFLAVENYSIMWPIVMIILVISLGSSAIAGEIDDGSIELLLAQPLSRAKIFISKYISGFFIIFLFNLVSILITTPLAKAYKVDYVMDSYLKIFILGSFFSFALYGMALLFSSIFSSRGKTSSAVAGIVIFMYVLKIIVQFKDSLNNLKYVSFFHYFDSNAALLSQKIDFLSMIVFGSVGFVCALLGLIVFIKRNIAT